MQLHHCCILPTLPPGVRWALHLFKETASITALSLPQDTVRFICEVTGGHSSPISKCHPGTPLHTQMLVCITLSGSEINWSNRLPPKEVSTYTDACMLLVRELDNQASVITHCMVWDYTHSHSLNLCHLLQL